MSTLAPIPPSAPPQRYVRPPAPRAAHPDLDDAFELRQFVRALLKHRWQVLVVAVMVVVPVAIWTFTTEPLFRATALVNIDPDPVQILPYREINQPSLTSNYELFMKSQDQLLRSSTLMSRLARRLAMEPDARTLAPEAAWLGGRVFAVRVENTQIFRLGYVAPNPETAARMANLYAEEYIQHHVEEGEKTREKARHLLQRELELLEARVQQSERQLVQYAQRNRLSPTRDADSRVQQRQDMIQRQNAEAEAVVFAARSRLETIEKASVAEFPQALITPVISTLVTRLLTLEHELTSLRATFGEKWPAVAQKRNEVTLVREQLDREKATALSQAREQAMLDYQSAENTRQMLAGSLARQERLVNMTDNASIEFNILRREVETNQKLYEGILERLRQANVTTGAEFGAFRVVEAATPPVVQDSPKVAWNLILSSFFGLALGICVALGRSYWDQSVTTVEEVAEVTRLPVLGSVPVVAAGAGDTGDSRWRAVLPARLRSTATALTLRRRGVSSDSDLPARVLAGDPAAAEAVRNICASVLLSRAERPPRVLLVTSTLPGEGKSTVAGELAMMLAERKLKTLLVECDLRRPTFATRFAVGNKGGLTLWLAGLDKTRPTQHFVAPCLKVVASGPPTPNPVVLLDSERMREFLSQAREAFEFVILDAPPVMGLADARVIAPMADGAIMVVRAGMAQKPSIDRACTLLESAGANVIGVVLNGAEMDDEGSYYYRRYYQTAG